MSDNYPNFEPATFDLPDYSDMMLEGLPYATAQPLATPDINGLESMAYDIQEHMAEEYARKVASQEAAISVAEEVPEIRKSVDYLTRDIHKVKDDLTKERSARESSERTSEQNRIKGDRWGKIATVIAGAAFLLQIIQWLSS